MINPVLRREVKTALRMRKTFYSIALYVLVLALVTSIALYIFSNNSSYYRTFDPQATIILYFMLSGFQLGIIFLIVPVLTGSSISGERERQTMDLMLITKLSHIAIVVGKLLSSLVIVLLMLAASMPVYAILFYYGGVSLLDLGLMMLLILANAAFIGSLSIFLSAAFKKSTLAVVVSYILILVFTIGTFVLAILFNWVHGLNAPANVNSNWLVGYVLLLFNPIVSFFSMVDFQSGASTTESMMRSVIYGTDLPSYVKYTWFIGMCINMVSAGLFILAAARKINPIRKHPARKVL